MIARAAALAAVAAEALAVYVLAEWIAASYADQGAVHALTFIVVALTAFLLPRVLDALALEGRAERAVVAVTAFVVLYGAVRLEFAHDLAFWDFAWVVTVITSTGDAFSGNGHVLVGVVLLLALWVRTSLRAVDDVELEMLPRTLALSFAAVTLVVVLAAASSRSAEVARAGAAFYAVAVLALACSQLALSGSTFGDLRAGGVTATLLAATAGATLACVLLFGLVFGFAGPVLGPPLGQATGAVMRVVLFPPAWLLEHLFRLLLGGNSAFPDLTGFAQDNARRAQEQPGEHHSDAARAAIYFMRALGLVVALALVAGLVAWVVRRRRRQLVARDDALNVTIAGGLGADLRAFWRGLLPGGGRPHTRRPDSAIARLYLETTARSARQGRPRAPAETPREFAPALEATLGQPVTREISHAFQEARYGAHEPGATVVAELDRRWRSGR